MSFFSKKRVLITGGNGFLGNHIRPKLWQAGCSQLFFPSSKDFDLRNLHSIQRLLSITRPHIVIHAAALCGGIEANRLRPGTFFYDNLMMGTQLIEESRKAGVEKFVALGTVCAYPKFTPVPFKEEDIWNGYPEETNAPYGLAKKMLMVQLQTYRQQYDFHGIYLVPVNLYGPGDNFDLTTSHVIPALIRKMIEARDRGDDEITLWGSGNASREFLYAEDCAEGVVMATEKYNGKDPVNLGTGKSITIKDLASIIKLEVGYEGKINWDTSKLDGQPVRQLDVSKAKEFGFEAKTSFSEGLRKTIEWYIESIKTVDTVTK